MFKLVSYLEEKRELIDSELARVLPSEEEDPAILHKAMRYSVLSGGKRIRPILCLAAAASVGGTEAAAVLPAIAVELLHAYTLIHDDLPCMDDDDLRRGKPSLHVAFGEANAILAGDALQALAFECAARVPEGVAADEMVLELARAAGSSGVVGGQVEDLASEGATPDAGILERIHRRKTASLFAAAVRMGGLAGGAGRKQLAALTRYGESLGFAFQIADDLLNTTSTSDELGKAAGSDAERGKLTAVTVDGEDGARRRAKEMIKTAIAALEGLGEREPLMAIAEFVVNRRS